MTMMKLRAETVEPTKGCYKPERLNRLAFLVVLRLNFHEYLNQLGKDILLRAEKIGIRIDYLKACCFTTQSINIAKRGGNMISS